MEQGDGSVVSFEGKWIWDEDLTVEVSHHIKEDFGNGKEYYAFQGSKLAVIPERGDQLPDWHYLEWHNENVFLG